MNSLVVVAVCLPLLFVFGAHQAWSRRIGLVVAPLPLGIVALMPEAGVALPRLLTGASVAVDPLNRPLLLLAAVGWCLAGWFASATVTRRKRGFALSWFVTLGGQALALLSADLATFYLGYVTMTLASYGLVVHERTPAARRAGRVYVVLALVGEALILAGLLSLGAEFGNVAFTQLATHARPGEVSVLLVLGFAVKLGIVPLHVWLPLAHPVAPSPASAVLSGLLVKAGLLGMLRFVPPQSLDAALWLSVGFFTAAYGVLAGLLQSRLKTVLAYSTVSQMGLALAAFAAVQVQASVMVVGVFALHHGLNKIALFLGSSHRWPTGLHRVWFVLPAAALAGLPFTSGMLAKTSLKGAMHTGGLDAWHVALTASSVTTTVLLMHALRLAREQSHGRASPHPAWICASVCGLALPWSWAVLNYWFTWDATAAWDASWPVALGVAIYGFGRRHLAHRPLRLPEGDLVVVAERLAEGFLRLRERLPTLAVGFGERYLERVTSPSGTRALERAFASTSILGVLVLCLMLGLWLAR